MALYGVLGDIHGPWENKQNLELALSVFEDLNVDAVILNGDVVDFYAINAHGPKHPGVATTIEDEFIWAENFITGLTKRFKEVVWIFGNHEFRLDRFVTQYCAGFYNFLRLEKMLRLKDIGVKWIPYNERYRVEKTDLFIQHSPPSYSENLANTSMKQKMDQDHIWNCAHRTDMVVKTGASGKIYTSYINGWFGCRGIIQDLQTKLPENRRVFAFTKNHEQWNSSFCLVATDGNSHHVNQVIIKDYKCQVGDTIYER